MKHFFAYIVFLFALFKSLIAVAAPELPEDFPGLRLRLYYAMQEEGVDYSPNMVDTFNFMLEIGKYFNDKYPGDSIYSEDMPQKVRPFFPQDTETELAEHTEMIQNGVSLYRTGVSLYNKYISEKLAPHSYRRVHSAEDFDHEGEVSYIEPPKGEFVKVYNFKKFLTYSSSADERKAINDYKKLISNDLSLLDKIDMGLRKIEWDKVLFYGTKYKNPLLSDLGTSKIRHSKNIDARLISNSIYLRENAEPDIAIDIRTRNNSYILANNLSAEWQKPQVFLDDSANLAEYKLQYPIPLNSISNRYAHKYFGTFLLPLSIKVTDTTKPLILRGKVRLTVCVENMECAPEEIDLSLTLAPNGTEFLPNGLDNYIQRSKAILPLAESYNYQLEKFVIDNNKDNPSLRLEFSTEESIKSFKIFVEDKNGYTRFSAPLISFYDNRIYVRLKPLDKTTFAELKDKEYIITSAFNEKNIHRTIRKPDTKILFDSQKPNLNIMLILFAILGGFLLNFMPCVFPVLSLKILSISNKKLTNSQTLQKSLFITTGGIFCGFSILIVILLIAKYLGISLGWGMQYQNITFLVIMTFVLSVFIAILPLLDFNNLHKKISSAKHKKMDFAIGNLIVLLSTPCTGPYLATAIGFALTGDYIDIICILYSVCIGLSAPYWLAGCLKNPETLFPKPGAWMNTLQKIMKLTLYLTILWFFSLIYNQTHWQTVLVLAISISVFIILLRLHLRFMDYLDGIVDERIDYQSINKTRRGSKIILCICTVLLCFWSANNAHKGYILNYVENIKNRPTFIDNKKIMQKLEDGSSILLEIGADWCMTCHVNNARVLNSFNLNSWKNTYNLELIKVDWTNYNKSVLDFMEQYGRKGLPFYILYTPLLRDGIVLPEMFSTEDLENILSAANKR